MNRPQKRRLLFKEAIIISTAYLLFGSAWIFFSDDTFGIFNMVPQVSANFQTYKGIAYVLITALLLFIILNKLIGKLKKQRESLDALVSERTAELEHTVERLKGSETQKDILLENMQRQLNFEKLIIELAQNFINADLTRVDIELESALQKIRDYIDEDGICYIKYDWEQERFCLQSQKNRVGVAPLNRDWGQISFKHAQDMIQAHLSGENYSIEDTQEHQTHIAGFLREDGIRSMITFPVFSYGKPRGFIALYSVNSVKTWKPYSLSVMTIFAQIIKNLYDRSDKEDALMTSHAHMRVILESTKNGICLMDCDGNIILANNAFACQYEKKLSDIVGHNIKALMPEDRYFSAEPIFRKVMETGVADEYRVVKNGRYYEGSIYPVIEKNQQITGVAVFVSDITRRINNEKEIYRTHKMFENLIQHAPVGIYWKDIDGHYLGCNQVAARNLCTSQEELIGQTNKNYMKDDVAETSSKHDLQIIESKKACLNHFTTMIRKDGQQKIFRINKVPLMDENGDVYALLGVAEDVTEQRLKEKELIQAKQEASAASKAKSDFLSNMSHEIRTPLNTIIGLTHVAAQSKDSSHIEDLLDKVNMSSKHLLSIVNNILDISRIEAGKFTVCHVETDIIAAIEEVFSIVTQHADEKKQHLNLYIDSRLPRYVLSDAIRFKQVLLNLLFNAMKFTPEAGEISVRAQVQKRHGRQIITKFSVEDNGIGIDEKLTDKLFRPFEQADGTSTREYEGAGLGLAISRSIVELMGGEIGATGKKGEGSTFYFVLPLEVAEEKPASLDVCFEELNILVVDDDKGTCEYMSSLLSQFGVKSDWTNSGKNALKAVKNAEPAYNVVFVDWQMPEMNGIDTVKEIRKVAGPDTFVIMFSMFEWAEIEHQAKTAGVSMFLTKPVLPSRLYNTLSQICKKPIELIKRCEDDDIFLRDRHILVAEDIEINQFIISELLKPTGVQITQAADGEQAFRLYKEKKGLYDAILMDIQMPVMDGMEATKRIRNSGIQTASSIPIIAMTANVFKEDIDKMLMAGMDAHIGKPVDPDVLIKTLKQFIV